VSTTEINEWLEGHGIRKARTLQSVVAHSFWEVLGEEKMKKKDLCEEELMKRCESRLRGKRRAWEFQGDHEVTLFPECTQKDQGV
jgi:hypothetical protein